MWVDDHSDDAQERVAEVIDWGEHVDKNKTDVSKVSITAACSP